MSHPHYSDDELNRIVAGLESMKEPVNTNTSLRGAGAGVIVGFVCGCLLILFLGFGQRYQIAENESGVMVKLDRMLGRTWVLENPDRPEMSYWRRLN